MYKMSKVEKGMADKIKSFYFPNVNPVIYYSAQISSLRFKAQA